MKKHIPNFLTLLNLLSGLVAILFAVINKLDFAAYFVVLGIFFDFFDGLAARLLNVQGELGKQLDSLADVVTSGVVPGLVMFQLISEAIGYDFFREGALDFSSWDRMEIQFLPFIGFLIPLASAYRLANFNIDERQTSSFIGLPTPANSLLIISLPLILMYSESELFLKLLTNEYVLIGITVLGTYLLNAELPLFSLKFKNYSIKDNLIKYIFLGVSVILLVSMLYIAIPLVILLYVLLSMVNNALLK